MGYVCIKTVSHLLSHSVLTLICLFFPFICMTYRDGSVINHKKIYIFSDSIWHNDTIFEVGKQPTPSRGLYSCWIHSVTVWASQALYHVAHTAAAGRQELIGSPDSPHNQRHNFIRHTPINWHPVQRRPLFLPDKFITFKWSAQCRDQPLISAGAETAYVGGLIHISAEGEMQRFQDRSESD